MLQAVQEQRPSHNNPTAVATSVTATRAKLLYYRCFAAAYRVAGGFADVIMANSSWTRRHLDGLWALPGAAAAHASRRGDGRRHRHAPAAVAGAVDSDSGMDADTGHSLADDDFLPAGGSGSAGPEALGVSFGAPSSAGERSGEPPAHLTYRPVLGVVASLTRALRLSAAPEHGRPAARIVYPPCNTDALSAMPLGWRYGSASSSGSATATRSAQRSAGGSAATSVDRSAADGELDSARSSPVSLLHSRGSSSPASGSLHSSRAASPVGDREEHSDRHHVGFRESTAEDEDAAAGNGASRGSRTASPDHTARGTGSVGRSSGGRASQARIVCTTRERVAVSVAQFRPEKDHALQIRAFAEFRRRGALARVRGGCIAATRLELCGCCLCAASVAC
jgi:hypothetical protein